MRKVFGFLVLGIAVSVGATISGWQMVEFGLSEALFKEALTELEGRKDPLLADLRAQDKDFDQKFFAKNVTGWLSAANSFVAPKRLENDYSFKDVCELFSQDCREFSLRARTNPGDFATANEHNYRICESNPNDLVCTEKHRASNLAKLLSRIATTRSFVQRACPIVTKAAVWHLSWQKRLELLYLSVQKACEENDCEDGAPSPGASAGLAIAELDTFLAEAQLLIDKPDWSSDKELRYSFLHRRYLDGGPEFVSELKTCLEQARVAIHGVAEPEIPVEPQAHQFIQDIMQFQEFPFPNRPTQRLWVQTRRLTFRDLAKIYRTIPPEQVLPPLRAAQSHEKSYAQFLGLGYWLSDLDPQHVYRIISTNEYVALNPGPFACTATHDYSLFGLDGVRLIAKGNSLCDYSNLIFVREKK